MGLGPAALHLVVSCA